MVGVAAPLTAGHRFVARLVPPAAAEARERPEEMRGVGEDSFEPCDR